MASTGFPCSTAETRSSIASSPSPMHPASRHSFSTTSGEKVGWGPPIREKKVRCLFRVSRRER